MPLTTPVPSSLFPRCDQVLPPLRVKIHVAPA
jgi:hypothetical protein